MYRLLIVDNEPNIVRGLYRLFEMHSGRLELDLCCAVGVDEAIAWSERARIDVALLDICMPGMTGLELHLRINEMWPFCKAIYLTGFNDFHYVQTALRQGGADYILKTEDDDIIVAAVEKAIAGIARAREAGSRFPSETGHEETHAVAARINHYILDHLDGDLSLARLADEVHLHPAYLCRLYKQLTGIGLSDKITEARVAKAMELLLHSPLRIHEIAQRVGLISASYFTRFFKKYAQLTPQDFRDSGGLPKNGSGDRKVNNGQ